MSTRCCIRPFLCAKQRLPCRYRDDGVIVVSLPLASMQTTAPYALFAHGGAPECCDAKYLRTRSVLRMRAWMMRINLRRLERCAVARWPMAVARVSG
ncbi:hypothetical protein XAC3218_170125 [Xanthomonas citri pv. citri]|nr:hypothetical protein XAC3218_170125 [Xanthomonas citri pv. citri]CEH52032.1 hypothetical protein XAC3610_2050008 [Xanthomonas citri pv. citri]